MVRLWSSISAPGPDNNPIPESVLSPFTKLILGKTLQQVCPRQPSTQTGRKDDQGSQLQDFTQQASALVSLRQTGERFRVSDIHSLQLLLFVYDCVNHITPDYLSDYFRHVSDVHYICTRQVVRDDLCLERRHTTQFGIISVQYPSPGGELRNVGYTGMCHPPGSIFHFQNSRAD